MDTSPRVNRVAILAERRLFRDAMASCLALDEELAIVGHAGSDTDLFDLCELRHPDVVLITVMAEIGTAVNSLASLRYRFATVRRVVVYERLSATDLSEIWHAGADDLIPSSRGLDALRVVLRRGGRGGPAPTRTAAGQWTTMARLTDEEREILALVGGGHSVWRIAELLNITTHAVENHKRRIYRKLDVASQSHAVARAAALGIISRPAVAPRPDARADVPLTIVRGPRRRTTERVVGALLAAGLPFVVESTARAATAPRWDWSHPGSVLLVLVNPAPEDVAGRDAEPLPVVLIPDEMSRRTEMVDALAGRVVAVVPADRIDEDLVHAVRHAAQRLPARNAVDGEALLESAGAGRLPDSGLPDLTARESDILSSIACGHTVRQTARSLGIAGKTVENIQARLFRKLGARNRAGAVAAAHALGLVEAVHAGTPPVDTARLAPCRPPAPDRRSPALSLQRPPVTPGRKAQP